jgi:hypothetical protein
MRRNLFNLISEEQAHRIYFNETRGKSLQARFDSDPDYHGELCLVGFGKLYRMYNGQFAVLYYN